MAKPRREPRHVVPAISFCIPVDFFAGDELYVGRLGDISQTGDCLVFPPHHRVSVGSSGPLVMHHPNVGEPIHARGELLWIDDLDHALYTGFSFLDPIDFERTFLRMLLGRSSGTSATGRLRSLRDIAQDMDGFDS
ncbi:MAG: PilZ domain-containing protein [Cyanobacteria bacterium M_surface_10_m2_119]|nr:PilZ domain-containing protein [Cyanobacteria bacterium M_surface_10_m2_119]